MMWISARGLCIALVATLIVAGCSGDSGDSGDNSEPIKVGVVLSLTGPASSLGTPARTAIDTFKDELSQVGDRRIEWIIEDDESDPTRAVAAVNRLIADGAAAVICCNSSPNSLAIQGSVEQAKLTNVALAGAAAVVEPAREKRWFFKTPPTDELTIRVLADHMKSQGIGSAGFLASDNAYGQSGREAFETVAKEKGIRVTGTGEFSDTDKDMTPQLTQLSRGNPDAYVVWGIPPAAAIAQRNLRELGKDKPAYQSFGVTNEAFTELAGDAAEGVLIAAGELLLLPDVEGDEPLDKRIRAFGERYEEATGNRPGAHAGYAYDAMAILHDAIGRALEAGAEPSDADGFQERLRDEVEETSEYVGVTGVFTYSPEDHVGLDERAVVMVEVQDGAFKGAGESR